MVKEITKLVFNEDDLKKFIASKYGLKQDNTLNIKFLHNKGDSREPETTTVIIEGEKASISTNYMDR